MPIHRQDIEGEIGEFKDSTIEVVQWLKELAKKDGVKRETYLGTHFSRFVKFAKGAKESKGPPPSGRHYGHYKVLAQEEDLLEVLYKIMECAVQTGEVLAMWKEVLQVLLLKDHPSSKVHCFRNITLIEADLMFQMKEVWANTLGGKIYETP